MKRIAFFQDNLDVGGIQKSIVNLLMNFDYTDCQVDLYLSDSKSFRIFVIASLRPSIFARLF